MAIIAIKSNLSTDIRGSMIFESCPCLWKGEGELKEATHCLSPPTKSEDPTEQKEESGRGPACGSRRRWVLGLIPFFPFTAAIALSVHYLTCECISVLVFYIFLRVFLSHKNVYIFNLHLKSHSAPVSDVFLLLLPSSALFSVLPRWQCGVLQLELLFRAD